jgi:hypothetical protein
MSEPGQHRTTIGDVLKLCSGIKRFIGRLREMRVTSLPRAGSPAYADWVSFPKGAHLRASTDQAVVCLEAAVEHLEGMVDALERTFVMVAWTCLRVEIEACAVSQALTAPDIDATTRVGRGLAVRQGPEFDHATRRPFDRRSLSTSLTGGTGSRPKRRAWA